MIVPRFPVRTNRITDIQHIETLLAETQSGIDRFKSSRESEASRVTMRAWILSHCWLTVAEGMNMIAFILGNNFLLVLGRLYWRNYHLFLVRCEQRETWILWVSRREGHDFFAEKQPVHGARAYYFKHSLHVWSNEKAAIILNNLKPAMQRGYSKILIDELIIPDCHAQAPPCMTDVAVIVFCSGLQPTRKRWANLLQRVGLRILNFWEKEGKGLGVTRLPEEDNLENSYH